MRDQQVPEPTDRDHPVGVTLVDERGRTRHLVRADGTPIADDSGEGVSEEHVPSVREHLEADHEQTQAELGEQHEHPLTDAQA